MAASGEHRTAGDEQVAKAVYAASAIDNAALWIVAHACRTQVVPVPVRRFTIVKSACAPPTHAGALQVLAHGIAVLRLADRRSSSVSRQSRRTRLTPSRSRSCDSVTRLSGLGHCSEISWIRRLLNELAGAGQHAQAEYRNVEW